MLVLGLLAAGDGAMAQPLAVRVEVDFATVREAPTLSGFLHGITATEPPDALVSPLRPGLVRTRDFVPELYRRVARLGARTQIVVSDTFGYGQNGAPWPFQNWERWEAHVAALARRAKGHEVLWDLWNEPDHLVFWKGSVANYLETFRRGHDVLRRELGPETRIVGPSLAWFDRRFLETFLEYCVEHHLKVDVLSWHELTDSLIAKIPDNVDHVRRTLLADPRYQAVGVRRIQVGEYGGAFAQHRPGELVAYLEALERAGVDSAAKACWPDRLTEDDDVGDPGPLNCIPLDGLVTPAPFRPRSTWWLYRAYAEEAGQTIESRASDPRVAVLAGRSRIILGYWKDRLTPPTATVTLALRHPPWTGCVEARLTILPNLGTQAVDAPESRHLATIGPGDDLVIEALPLHAAAVIRLDPVIDTGASPSTPCPSPAPPWGQRP